MTQEKLPVSQAAMERAAAVYDELTGRQGRTDPREMSGDWLARHFARFERETRRAK